MAVYFIEVPKVVTNFFFDFDFFEAEGDRVSSFLTTSRFSVVLSDYLVSGCFGSVTLVFRIFLGITFWLR